MSSPEDFHDGDLSEYERKVLRHVLSIYRTTSWVRSDEDREEITRMILTYRRTSWIWGTFYRTLVIFGSVAAGLVAVKTFFSGWFR